MRTAMEHHTDPCRRLLGDHARDAELPVGDCWDCARARDLVRGARALRFREPDSAVAGRADVLVHLVHAMVAASYPPTRPRASELAAHAGVTARSSAGSREVVVFTRRRESRYEEDGMKTIIVGYDGT